MDFESNHEYEYGYVTAMVSKITTNTTTIIIKNNLEKIPKVVLLKRVENVFISWSKQLIIPYNFMHQNKKNR